jgi:catalase
MSATVLNPVLYRAGIEQPEPDEAETIAGLNEALREILDTTFKDYGHPVRSVHAKSHGLLQGKVIVPALPPQLAQGMFATPGTYDAILRLSTNPGDILDDSVSTPRGMAIKIMGVEGERLPGAEGESTQNFVMVNAPAFNAKNPKAFLKSLKLLAKTTDTSQGWKKVFSAVARGAETVIEAVGGESGTLKGLGGHPMTNILGETFYTVVPVRFGDYVAKLSIAPVSASLKALKDAKLDLKEHPDGLREAVNAFFAQQGAEWEIRVQLCTDLETMPIEDATVVWPEEQSPYVTIARIMVPAQTGWSKERVAEIDDKMVFGPWDGLAAHQPLGGIMRARKDTYKMSSDFRGERLGCPMHEPRAAADLPD